MTPEHRLAFKEGCTELCVRVSGNVICETCKLPYWRHPYCRGQLTTITGEAMPFLHVGCDGRHLKL